MRKFAKIASLSLMFIGSACQMNEIDNEYQNELEITAHSDIVVTKTQMESETAAGQAVSILWSPGDAIGVFGDRCSNVKFESSIETAAKTGKFKGAAAAIPEYAYYPYNEAAGNDYHQISVSIPGHQSYEGPASLASADIKYGVRTAVDGSNVDFSFSSAATLLRFTVDLTGFDGVDADESAYLLQMTAYEGDVKKSLAGSFELNAETGALTPDGTAAGIELTFGGLKKAGEGAFVTFAAIAPEINSGDRIEIVVRTDRHYVTYTAAAKCDFVKGCCYDMPLDFKSLPADKVSVRNYTSSEGASAIKSITFLASLNSPAILDKEVYYDASGKKTTYRTSAGEKITADANGDLKKVIPYLYDFNLVPTLEMEDSSAGYLVTVNGQEVQSGKTRIDFSHDVLFSVRRLDTDETCEQLVSVRNTGLPVVVANLDYSGSAGATFAGIKLPPKSSEFAEDHQIAIYNPDGSVDLENMNCGLRLRGNYSATMPKKPIAVKLASKKKVLGMPKHKRWCLIANWFDRTLIRNSFTYYMAEQVAAVPSTTGPGLGWQPHGRYVELVLNGRYVGNYYLCEQIKMDDNRVNMPGFPEYEQRQSDYAKNPSTAEAPSYDNCGYLLEFDNNGDPVDELCYQTPKYVIKVWSKNDYDEAGLQNVWGPLKQDIGTLVNNLNKLTSSTSKSADELAAIEYVRGHIDYDSAADFMLIYELVMNHDYSHPKSVYLRKAGRDGKFVFGPVWDFDVYTYPHMIQYKDYETVYTASHGLAFKKSIDKWQWETLQYADHTDSFWWFARLLREQAFVDAVKARWAVIRPALPAVSKIDEMSSEIALSAQFDGAMWPQTDYDPINMKNGDEWMTYEDAIGSMKQYYNARVSAMDGMVGSLTVNTIPSTRTGK